eukprot:11422177-Alexandrium_andersonii.AAC.1
MSKTDWAGGRGAWLPWAPPVRPLLLLLSPPVELSAPTRGEPAKEAAETAEVCCCCSSPGLTSPT